MFNNIGQYMLYKLEKDEYNERKEIIKEINEEYRQREREENFKKFPDEFFNDLFIGV